MAKREDEERAAKQAERGTADKGKYEPKWGDPAKDEKKDKEDKLVKKEDKLVKRDGKKEKGRPRIDGREITPNPALERSLTEAEKSYIEQRNTTQEEDPIEEAGGGEEGGGGEESDIPAEAPVFSPAAGSYPAAQSVTMTSATPGATIHYTTDGSEPTTASPAYSAPVSVSATSTLKALAAAPSLVDSPVTSADYTITPA